MNDDFFKSTGLCNTMVLVFYQTTQHAMQMFDSWKSKTSYFVLFLMLRCGLPQVWLNTTLHRNFCGRTSTNGALDPSVPQYFASLMGRWVKNTLYYVPSGLLYTLSRVVFTWTGPARLFWDPGLQIFFGLRSHENRASPLHISLCERNKRASPANWARSFFLLFTAYLASSFKTSKTVDNRKRQRIHLLMC